MSDMNQKEAGMSIKIHNGLLSEESDVFKTGRMLRQVVEPIFIKKFTESKERLFNAAPYAKWSDFGLEGDDSLVGPADDSLQKYNIEEKLYQLVQTLHAKTTRTFNNLSFGYDIGLLPNGNEGGNPLVMIFSEDEEYRSGLVESGVVQEYAYWNNVDRRDDVTQEEWLVRKQAWTTLDDHSPAEMGVWIPMLTSMGIALWQNNF